MTDDAISRTEAMRQFTAEPQMQFSLGQIVALLDALPAVDAVEVRRGRWIDPNGRQTEQERFNWQCSECGHFQHSSVPRGRKEFGIQNRFCAYCGARMDGQRREDASDA